MSFKSNDINLANYEEYFILYMDNELNAEQKKKVDAFLLEHPHLQSELDILMSTKLPEESFSFEKEGLLAQNMKLNGAEEDLLLYIDGELPADKIKLVGLEVELNPSYKKQLELLSRTKLDPAEQVLYPDKEELYRRTEKIVPFTFWMRIAAMVIIIAGAGVLYFTNKNSDAIAPPLPGTGPEMQTQVVEPTVPKVENTVTPPVAIVANEREVPTKRRSEQKAETNDVLEEANNSTALIGEAVDHSSPSEKAITTIDEKSSLDNKAIAFEPSKRIINNSGVTSLLSIRNTYTEATEPTVPASDVADSERKGSIKSFLRKATRLIERKTGIDPTNGDDELLIGAVAVKLK